MGDLDRLFKMNFVAGYEIPAITPLNYRVKFSNYTSQNPAFKRIEWHSQFELSCCEGCGCCFPWCCVTPKCNGEKNVHDYIEQGKNTAGDATMTIVWTEAFGNCGVCCGCESGKEFIWFDSNGHQVFVASSEVFVFAEKDVIPADDRKAIEAEIVRRKLRKDGFTLRWF